MTHASLYRGTFLGVQSRQNWIRFQSQCISFLTFASSLTKQCTARKLFFRYKDSQSGNIILTRFFRRSCLTIIAGETSQFSLFMKIVIFISYSYVYFSMLIDSFADVVQYVFQVLEIARSVTNQTSNGTAKELFIKRLNESDMYFADKPIPENESNANAHVLCSSVEGAKKYCPNRWRAMQNWFAESKKVNNEITKYMLQLVSLLPHPPPPLFLFLCLTSSILFVFLYLVVFPPRGRGHGGGTSMHRKRTELLLGNLESKTLRITRRGFLPLKGINCKTTYYLVIVFFVQCHKRTSSHSRPFKA